ncbi:MAG: hypothetical protein RSC59_01885 [Erysipelotrichaceae bacterium]
MNKIQKISLLFSVFALLNNAIYVLLGFPMLYAYLKEGYFITYFYAFLIGISAFINLTIFNSK